MDYNAMQGFLNACPEYILPGKFYLEAALAFCVRQDYCCFRTLVLLLDLSITEFGSLAVNLDMVCDGMGAAMNLMPPSPATLLSLLSYLHFVSIPANPGSGGRRIPQWRCKLRAQLSYVLDTKILFYY